MWCSNQPSINLHDEPPFDSSYFMANCEDSLAVVKKQTVVIYDKTSLQELVTYNFDSEVNAATWTDTRGRFLLVAEHSGQLHTIHSASQKAINSEHIYETYNDVSKTFQQVLCVEQSNEMYLLGSGVLHCFLNMDYASLDSALCEGSMQKAAALRQRIVHLSTSSPQGANLLIPGDRKEGRISLIVLGGENCCLSKLTYENSMWAVTDETALYGYGDMMQGFKVTPRYLLTLTNKGFLILWNTLTWTPVKIWGESRWEKMAPLTPVSNRLSDCKIVVLGRLTSTKQNSVSILALPRYDVIHSAPTSASTIADNYTSQLSIHWIDGMGCANINLTSIAQINPDARYEMMISRQQYTEALLFAKQHQLDPQLVYEARARVLSSDITLEEFATFKACLDELSNAHAVVDICLQAASACGKVVHRVLEFARQRLDGVQHRQCSCDRTAQVLTALQRFTTYSLAYGLDSFTSDRWQSFLTCDMLVEVLRLSALEEHIPTAMAVWSRHKYEMRDCITKDWLDKFLLACLKPTLDCDTTMTWLSQHLIPLINAEEELSYAELLASHMERLARDYELSDRRWWPANSLALCSLVDEVTSVLLNSSLTRLRQLREELTAIQELSEVYHCSISYTEYCKQSRESIVYRLLDSVAVPSLFPDHYEKVAQLYMTQYCIHADKSLLNYVSDLIARYEYIRGYDCIGLLWEQKAVAVVDCIMRPRYKVLAVTELAKRCQVPWSKCIAELVEGTCHPTSEGIDELMDIRKNVALTHLLSLYNVPKEVTPSSRNALKLIKYILKASGASLDGLRHALQVGEPLMVEEQTIYIAACQARLMALRDVYDIVTLMGDMRKQVLHRLMNQCAELCNGCSGITWEVKQHWAEVVISLLSRYPQCTDAGYFMAAAHLSSHLKSLILLKSQYGIDVTLTALSSSQQGVAYLEAFLRSLIKPPLPADAAAGGQGDCGGQTVMTEYLIRIVTDNFWRLFRVSELMFLTKPDLFEVIYKTTAVAAGGCSVPTHAAAGGCSVPTHTKVLKMIVHFDRSSEATSFLLTKLRHLLQLDSCAAADSRELLRLCQICATSSSNDDLQEAAGLLSVARYRCDLLSNCLGGVDNMDMSGSECDREELETLFTRKCHTEKDLIVSTARVSGLSLELLRLILSGPPSAVSAANNAESWYVERHDSYQEILKSNNHDMLRTRMSVLLYYSYACQFSAANDSMVKLRNHLSNRLKLSVTSLISKLISPRNLDVHLILAALLELPVGTSLSLVKKSADSFGSRFLRILGLTNVALIICTRYNQNDYLKRATTLKQEAVWGYTLDKYGVNFLPVFGKLHKDQLLSRVAMKCPLSVLDRYISDFGLGLDSEQSYFSRLQYLANAHNSSKFWERRDPEANRLLSEIAVLLPMLANLSLPIQHMVEELCNPYNYSLIRTLLPACGDSFSRKNLRILDFLTMYKRQSSPSDWELTYVEEFWRVEQIAYMRLPYQPVTTKHIWKVLCAELNVRTFHTLQPLTSLLEIKTDVFLLETALQIAKSHIGHLYKQTNPTSDTNVEQSHWATADSTLNTNFLNDIMTILAAIQDKKSAVMCSQSLIDKLPSGAEKILVTKICMDLCRTWKESVVQGTGEHREAEIAHKRVSTEHILLCVEQCLHQYNLATEENMELMEHPTQLVQRILETTHTDSSARAEEKFEACSCLAHITGRDIAKMCYDLITEWLSIGEAQTSNNIDMDMTMTLDMATMMSTVGSDDSSKPGDADNHMKEKWIVHLANSSIGHKIIHLLNSILNSLAAGNGTRLLVTRCFLLLGDASLASLGNESSPSNYIQLTAPELCRQYKALRYIERLQSLNITMSVEEFYSCDLTVLIASLRKNYSTNPTAVGLYADLCVEVSHYDVATWRSLLQQLLQLNMVEKLAELLPLTSQQTRQLWALPVYKQAWQLISDKSSSSVQYQAALTSCPVLGQLKR